jgi:hypothetical protein
VDASSGPLFVEKLYREGEIASNTFSIKLGRNNTIQSWLNLGGLPPDFTLQQNTTWNSHRIAGSFHWQAKLNKIWLGSN